jgi:hypothetical protein
LLKTVDFSIQHFRHCEERKRRSNPLVRYAVLWIASLRSQ